MPRQPNVLHLTESPAEAQLLQSQLDEELEGARVDRADDGESLDELLRARPYELMIVDLPLPDEELDPVIARIQADNPSMDVLFRWRAGGAWHYADASEPLSGIVRQTLQLGDGDPPGIAEREHMLGRVVRSQEVFLRLSQTDYWEFAERLRELTSAVAGLMDVERVSVWELDADDGVLRCLDLYERSARRHSQGQELRDFPLYQEALSSSLMIAAHDAREDPRTSEFRDGYLEPLGITSMLDAPIRSRGRVRGVVCIEHVGPRRHWDLFEQCHAASTATIVAQALETRDRRLLEERLHEAERLTSLGRMAARLAHDFNNRLTVIRGELDFVMRDLGGDRETWAPVLDELGKAAETARDLMNLHRRRTAKPQALDVAEVTRTMRPVLEGLVGGGVRFQMEVGELPLPVAMARLDFEQVLLNLATNARDAVREGGRVLIHLARRGSGGDRAVLRVEDDGPGMDEETRRHAFEPFATTKSPEQGSGLGLASVYAVVRDAGGDVRVEGEVGRGTRVVVELPLEA